jgi:hypothetical protein
MSKFAFSLALVATTFLGGCNLYSVSPPRPKSENPQPEPAAPVSHISLIAATSWPSLVSKLDSAIPRCAGAFPVCQGGPGTFILQHEDAWDIVGNVPVDGDIGMKGSVWRWDRVNANLSNGSFSSALTKSLPPDSV